MVFFRDFADARVRVNDHLGIPQITGDDAGHRDDARV